MGVPIPIGTGLFQLLHQVDKVEKTKLVDTFSKSAKQQQQTRVRTVGATHWLDDPLTFLAASVLPCIVLAV